MVTVDHNINIQRIIDVMNADSSLFDSGATLGKLRSIQFGDPPNMTSSHFPMPYAYVTTASDVQETSPEIGTSIPNNVKSVNVEYQIVVVATSKSRQSDAQKQLYDLIKNIRTLTEGNPTFLKPVSNDDPIFVRSILSNVAWEQQTRGQLVTVITMTLLATIGVLFTLTVPGVTDPIPLLSKPIDRDNDSFESILDDTLIRKDTAPINSIRNIFAEFESSTSVLSTLRTIKLSRASNSYTITNPTGAEAVTAYLTQIESSTGFTDMETTIIQLEVVTP